MRFDDVFVGESASDLGLTVHCDGPGLRIELITLTQRVAFICTKFIEIVVAGYIRKIGGFCICAEGTGANIFQRFVHGAFVCP